MRMIRIQIFLNGPPLANFPYICISHTPANSPTSRANVLFYSPSSNLIRRESSIPFHTQAWAPRSDEGPDSRPFTAMIRHPTGPRCSSTPFVCDILWEEIDGICWTSGLDGAPDTFMLRHACSLELDDSVLQLLFPCFPCLP
jgi:hypothetical protein